MVFRTLPNLVLRHFGPVAAGFPSPAQGYEEEPLDLNALLIHHPAATFFYRAKGHELIRDGIRDGAVLVVDRSITPTPGRLVVADQDGQRVVCRVPSYRHSEAGAIEAEELIIWGVVTAIITKV